MVEQEYRLAGHTFAHVSYVVETIDVAIDRWSARFGVDIADPRLTPDTRTGLTRYWGSRTPARARQVQFQVSDLWIELLEPVGSPSIWKDHLDRFGEGLHHIAYWVDDMERALERYLSRGASVSQTGVFPEGRTGRGGEYAFVEWPSGGTAIELLADRDFGDWPVI